MSCHREREFQPGIVSWPCPSSSALLISLPMPLFVLFLLDILSSQVHSCKLTTHSQPSLLSQLSHSLLQHLGSVLPTQLGEERKNFTNVALVSPAYFFFLQMKSTSTEHLKRLEAHAVVCLHCNSQGVGKKTSESSGQSWLGIFWIFSGKTRGWDLPWFPPYISTYLCQKMPWLRC